MRQFAHEADRVGQQELEVVVERDAAGGRVQRREKLVFNQDFRPGERPEDGGFPDVGVADDRAVRHGVALPRLALGGALLADGFKLFAKLLDAPPEQPPVGFDLGFALAAGGGAAAVLAGEVGPGAGQARQRILRTSQLHLQHGFTGLRAFRENIEDHLLAVDHAGFGEPLPVALLGRRQRGVEDQAVRFALLRDLGDFSGFAGADVILRHHRMQVDDQRFEGDDVKVADEVGEFVQMLVHFGVGFFGGAYADQQGAFHFLSGI